MMTGYILAGFSSPFNLDGGSSIDVSAIITELVSGGGGYIARVEIIESDNSVIASSQRDIFISSGDSLVHGRLKTPI